MKAQEREWQLAKRVFQHAIDLPADKQADYVQSQCTDEETCDQVLQMLRDHFDESDFLSSPFSIAESSDELSRDPLLGRSFGSFQIQQRIGKGGMGAVYEATQSDPRRQVAVKVLRHDNAIDDSTLRRFQNESEVLAKLQHPNIAHVYASGTFRDEEGVQPWFAMELVNGFTLKQFLRQADWSEKQKLDLFLRICDGVSHAHQRGVVHRDLKPENILVKDSSSPPQPKIVDFGIARIAAGSTSGSTMTKTQAVLGSIDYLSPEQVNFENDQLDHRCDIYSLGVVFFEMLTGKLPHDRRSGSLAEVLSQIQFDPGFRLRHIDRRYSKDLEVIVSKALDPDRNRRFQTVEELSGDLRRYLRREPILSHPPSAIYRLTKYISRNKVLVGGAATTILALAIGLVTYANIAQRANKSAADAKYEARKAVAVNSFITNDFLTRLLHNVRSEDSSGPIELNKLIEAASSRIGTMFSNDPLLEAAVRNEVGTIYYNVRSFEEAAGEYSQALELWENGLGAEHPDTLKAVNNLAQANMGASLGTEPRTLALCVRAFEGRQKVLGMQHEATIHSLNNLAQLYVSQKKYQEAERLFVTGLDAIEGASAKTLATKLTLAANLGTLYVSMGRMDEALQLHEQSFESAKQVFGMNHPLCLQTGIRYVQTLEKANRYEDAAEELQPILNEYEKISQSDLSAMFLPLRLHARILRRQGEPELARGKLNQALNLARESPEKYDLDIRKIKRDLRRLDRN